MYAMISYDTAPYQNYHYCNPPAIIERMSTEQPIIGLPEKHNKYSCIINALEDAAYYTGLPLAWAKDRHLLTLIENESNFSPHAQSSTSSAFGVFQMLKRIWEIYLPEASYGTHDLFWQCVGGIRYISHKYGTPERANKFRLATALKDPNIAPPDLQGKAKTWILNGLVGY